MQRITFSTLLAMLMLLAANTFDVQAKRVVVPEMYMFGMAASFNDTIVYFTEIQRVDSAWIDKKTGFLQSRDLYSLQLRTYLSQAKQLPDRTCVVFYNQKRERLEKTLLKMRHLYSKGKDGVAHFDMRELSPDEFKFVSTDLTGLDEAETMQALADEYEARAAKQSKKKKK